jgi:hypothetical protein
MSQGTHPALPMIGYRVVEVGGDDAIGEVEGIGWYCLRVHRIPGAPGRVVYVPARAIVSVGPASRAIVLAAGIGIDQMLAAPVPSACDSGAWHRSPEWWADLLAHYGYWAPEPAPVGAPPAAATGEAGDDRFRHARRAIAGLSSAP